MDEQTEATESALMRFPLNAMAKCLRQGLSERDAAEVAKMIEGKCQDEFLSKHGRLFMGMDTGEGFSQSFVTEYNRETGDVTATAPPSGFMQDVAEGKAEAVPRRELGYLDGRLEAQCELHAANQRADNAISDLAAARAELAALKQQIADAEPLGWVNVYEDGSMGLCRRLEVSAIEYIGPTVLEVAVPVYRHPAIDTEADKAAVEKWRQEVLMCRTLSKEEYAALLARVTRVAPAPAEGGAE